MFTLTNGVARIPKDGRTIKLNQGSIVSLFAFGKVEKYNHRDLPMGLILKIWNREPGVFITKPFQMRFLLNGQWRTRHALVYRF